jgi:hypothetical protein
MFFALLIELFRYQLLTKLPSHRFPYLRYSTGSVCNVPCRRDLSFISTKKTGTRLRGALSKIKIYTSTFDL